MKQIQVWCHAFKRYVNHYLAPMFKSICTFVMVWGAFTKFDKCPLVVMPQNEIIASSFNEIVYEGTLSSFCYLHDCLHDLYFIGDKTLVLHGLDSDQWRVAQCMKTLKWLANSLNPSPIKNLWKMLENHVQWESRHGNREEMIRATLRAWEDT
jgi:hypothetical protein